MITLPALRKRSENNLISWLKRMADRVPMYKAERMAARPPQIMRLPRNKPLSRFKGATPTRAASSYDPKYPTQEDPPTRSWKVPALLLEHSSI